MYPGSRNLITDVPGLTVGNAEDHAALTGVTVLVPDDGAMVAAADVRGGAPGTRDISALEPSCLVESIHGLVLAGGSVFGLDAAGGVIEALKKKGVGFTFPDLPFPCPVVPSAILFDLGNGSEKAKGETPPYRALGSVAVKAAGKDFSLGNSGVGLGATAGKLKGGLGSASMKVGRYTVGALVAVNSFGTVIDPRNNTFWAAAWEVGDEFGGVRPPNAGTPAPLPPPLTGCKIESSQGGANTTIAIVATDAKLSKAEAQRLAIMAADGMSRAIRPLHTPYDGDVVFAVSTAREDIADPTSLTLASLGTAAADTLTRAIARGVYEAEAVGTHQSWRALFAE
ncbi:unnamed protein product [Agarophyton chilense]|eukprot:gb/GEZJ01004089.1/.p1 GENE.gb/GEZJ01004089.1/~~gb/GEZJ01004089.1/.p1  ORF type:complete len:340 (-),score=37.07 gb/GEZJ01004089.1/:1190-2209(-)